MHKVIYAAPKRWPSRSKFFYTFSILSSPNMNLCCKIIVILITLYFFVKIIIIKCIVTQKQSYQTIVVLQNTGPSHSVGANVQRVFSLMKNHNMALCSHASYPLGSCQSSRRSSDSSVPSTETDLAEILFQLQDEFHQMSL